MIEKQIKDDYRLGKRKGITELDDFFYMPVRITGSGLNIRQADGQIIVADRQTGDFFNEAFIEHCKSLPIIVEHPVDENNEKDMLHTDSLASNQIVGNTIDAWIENDSEIWGLARLYDKTILDKIESGEIQSTSPGVRIFFDEKSDPDFKREIPYGINHLAFCERGHWDKPDGKAFDNSEKSKIDLTFNKDLCILNKTEESEVSQMQAEKANDIPPVVAGAIGGAVAGKAASDSEEKVAEVAEKQDEAKTEEPKKATDSENADEKADEAKDKEDSKDGEKANDAGVDLSNAASLMAKASHAGVISKDKEDEVAEVTPKQEKEEKVEEKVEKQDETPTKEDSKKADDSEECIDSADETEDDKKRESELKEMRKVCDSADANLGVKMPYISGRQTYRSIAHKFIQSNKQFLDKKYANLALDSYTPELAEEVLKSVYANIAAKSSKPKEVRVGNYVEINGVLCDPNF